MVESNWPRHVVRVGAFEFRRTLRSLRNSPGRLVVMAAGALLPSLVFVGLGIIFLDALGGLADLGIPNLFRGMVALFWLFGSFLVAQRVGSTRPGVGAESLILTTVSARTVAGGLFLAEMLRILAYIGGPVLAVTSLLTYALLEPILLLTAPLAAILFVATATLVGSLVGYVAVYLLTVSPFIARHKTLLATPLVLLVTGGYVLFTMPSITGIDQSALAVLPVGWFIDLAVIGTSIDGSLSRAVIAGIGSVGVLVGGGVLLERVTEALWFSDGPATDTEDEDETEVVVETTSEHHLPSETGVSDLSASVSPFRVPSVAARPTRRVAEMAVLRTWRNPRRLSILLMPIAIMVSSIISGGASLPLIVLPVASAAVVPWMAGAAFSLNPFGDEGNVLPVSLLAVTGQRYVRGLLLPGLLLGGPFAIGITTVTAVVVSLPVFQLVALLGVTVFVLVVAVVLAPAVGMWLPRFSGVSIGQSDEVLPPRTAAVTVHTIAVLILGGLLAALVVAPTFAEVAVALFTGFLPGLVLQFIAENGVTPLAGLAELFLDWGALLQALSTSQLRLLLGVPLVGGGVVMAVVAYRDAVRRFDQFSPMST